MEIITGKYLKELREQAHLSQTQLAELIGISQAHIAKIEGEKVNPRLSTVNRIVAVLLEKEKVKTCKEIMRRRIVKVSPSDAVEKVVEIMKKLSISQIPVFQRGKPVGSIRDSTLVRNMGRNLTHLKVRDIVDAPFPVVNATDSVEILPPLMEFHPAVLVVEKGVVVGIVTKSNLLGMR